MTDETSGPAEPVTDATGDAKSSSVTAAPPRRRLRLLLTVAAVVLFVDVVTKVLAVRLLTPGQPVSIIGDTVTWTLVRNSGAAFSMATGYTWVLTLIATGVVIGIVWMGRRLVSPWWAIGLGMILGGATGNLIDRFFRAPGPLRGHVVDFFSVGWWPVFNVADPAVVGGAILLVALSLFGFDFDTVGRRRLGDPSGGDAKPQPEPTEGADAPAADTEVTDSGAADSGAADTEGAEDVQPDEPGEAESPSGESSTVGRQAETS